MRHCIIILCVVAIIATLSGCKEPVMPTEEPTHNIATIAPTEQPITELPPIEDIKPGVDPLLYDFVAGCLDWHIPISRDVIDSDLYILRHESSPEILYTDWYIIQGGYATPPQGSEIERVVLNARDLDTYNAALNEIPDAYIIRNNGWELVICAGQAASILGRNQLMLRSEFKYADGRNPPFLESGEGWPTDWLRREPYVSKLLSSSDIDMSSEWWDTFRLRASYRLTGADGAPCKEGYYAVCTNVWEFMLCDSSGTVATGMSWDALRETCNALQYDIPDVYEHGTWEDSVHE